MTEPVFKLLFPGENYTLEIYEIEPGKLFIGLNENGEDESAYGGWIEVETKTFMDALNKLLSK